jgi:hypothetical protein
MIINDYDYYGEWEEGNNEVYMLVMDNNDNWYLINEDDLNDFYLWDEAIEMDFVHHDRDFSQFRIKNPSSIRFSGYWDVDE